MRQSSSLLHPYISDERDAACMSTRQPMAANDDAGAGNEEAAASDGGEKPVVLITGCAKGGIGYEYCHAFSALGCRVVATDIPDRVPDLAADLAGDEAAADDTLPLPLDVTSDASVASAVRRVLAEHGRIDVLVNNAGIGCTGPLAELPLDSVRRAMDVNFLGQVRMVRAVAPHMASSRRGGRVVNVGSVVGTAATPWAAPYCASKAAVHAATDALRLELRPFGVHVVKVVPGAVRSGLGHANAAALQGRPEQWGMYREFVAAIEERARASQAGGATEAGAFARHVARKVMRPRPPREIVYGSMTLLFAALAAAPAWARDAFFARRFGLHGKKMKRKTNQKQASRPAREEEGQVGLVWFRFDSVLLPSLPPIPETSRRLPSVHLSPRHCRAALAPPQGLFRNRRAGSCNGRRTASPPIDLELEELRQSRTMLLFR